MSRLGPMLTGSNNLMSAWTLEAEIMAYMTEHYKPSGSARDGTLCYDAGPF